MTRRRGDLYRDVLAVMPAGVVLGTAQITAAVPGVSRALVGVCMCRCVKKGLVVRVDAAPGTKIGNHMASWMATGKPYEVGKGGGRPQPAKPHSRHKPKPAIQRPTDIARSEPAPHHATPKPAAPESVADFIARGGRIQKEPSSYVPLNAYPRPMFHRGAGSQG